MKTLSFGGALCVLAFLAATARGQIITQWNFNSLVPDASTATGSLVASFGSGTASTIGGVSGSFAAGSPGDAAAADNTAWSLTGWPAQGTNSGTAGAQFLASTAGFSGQITVSFDLRQTATASERFQLQVTSDGLTYVNASGGTASFGAVGNNTATSFDASGLFINTAAASSQAFVQSLTYTFLAGSAVENNALFGFRLVSVFDGVSYDEAGASASYGTTGTLRLDRVTVASVEAGVAVPEPATSALAMGILAGAVVGVRRLRRRSEDLTVS